MRTAVFLTLLLVYNETKIEIGCFTEAKVAEKIVIAEHMVSLEWHLHTTVTPYQGAPCAPG